MTSFEVSEAQVAQFNEDGYLFVENLYSPEEMELLMTIGRSDQAKAAEVRTEKDADGRESKLWLASDTSREDIYNAICHGRRMVDTMAKLLADEVYLYHYKMMVKEPRVGGAWEWHQDYGYWYDNGCLYPDMGSCMIAVDRAYKGNGCLQVLRGSHKMGRIDHGTTGTQAGADLERIAEIEQHCELVHAEMSPGTALFFHANLLHRSAANTSDDPRWTLICCYNTRHNPCHDLPGHPSYQPLEIWDDSRVLEIGRKQADAAAT